MCPNAACGELIAIVSDDTDTTSIYVDGLTPNDDAPKDVIASVASFLCPKCRESFARINGKVSLHTNYGWT